MTDVAGLRDAQQREAAARAYLGRLREDFVFFAQEIWRATGSDKFAALGDVELDILRWIANSSVIKRGVLAWRGIGKTHFGTAAYTLWRLFRDHDCKILIVSKSFGEAKKTVGLIRQWIDNVWFLNHLQPARGHDKTDAAHEFDVGPSSPARNCSVTACGIEGQLPSKRAHVIIADDVETPENTKTLDARHALSETVSEFRAISSFGEKEIVYIGTFHHEESLYIKLAKKGYQFYSWPKCYPEAAERVHNLAPMLQNRLNRGEAKPGDITCPHRVTIDDIAADKAEGRRYWAMQCMLIADLGDELRYPLQLADFICVDSVHRDKAPIRIAWGKSHDNKSTERPEIKSLGFMLDRFYGPAMTDGEWAPYTSTYMRIDPSGRGADKTGWAVASHLNGMIWGKAIGGLEGGSTPENIEKLAWLAFEHRVRVIRIESNFGGDAWANLLMPAVARVQADPRVKLQCPEGWGASVELVHSTGQKELRILAALEPPLAAHRIVIGPEIASNEAFQYQLTRLTRLPKSLDHEDELEAFAMVIGDWMNELRLDTEKAAVRTEERLIQDQEKALRKLRGLPVVDNLRWFNHR